MIDPLPPSAALRADPKPVAPRVVLLIGCRKARCANGTLLLGLLLLLLLGVAIVKEGRTAPTPPSPPPAAADMGDRWLLLLLLLGVTVTPRMGVLGVIITPRLLLPSLSTPLALLVTAAVAGASYISASEERRRCGE
jgi:hypothetical protein